MASSKSTNRWLITGGCGFLGTALIKYLRSNNLADYIRVLDNLSVGTRDDLASVTDFKEKDAGDLTDYTKNLGVELIVGDIRDPDVCVACCQGIDVVVHLAANTGVPVSVEKPRLDMESNVIGIFNMLEGASQNKCKRFVFASSGAPAGEVVPPIHEELPPHPVSPYGASKLAGEGYCSAYYKTFGLETVALRFSNVYGPGSTKKTSVVAKFIKQALNGECLYVYGDGTQTRDFIYIDDLIRALVLSATKEQVGGETFQIASSRETTIDELITVIMKIFDKYEIKRPDVIKSQPRLGDVKRNYSNTDKARDRLNWKCQFELKQGIDQTIKWFVNSQVP